MRLRELLAEIKTDMAHRTFDTLIDAPLADRVWTIFIKMQEMSDNFSIPSYELDSSDAEDFRIAIRSINDDVESRFHDDTQTIKIMEFLKMYLEMWDLIQ
jgi:hypothetical protein